MTFQDRCGVERPSFGRWFREIQENLRDFLAALSQTAGEKGKECRGHRKTEGVGASKQQETRIDWVMGRCHVADVRCASRRFENRQPLDTGKLFSTYHLILCFYPLLDLQFWKAFSVMAVHWGKLLPTSFVKKKKKKFMPLCG